MARSDADRWTLTNQPNFAVAVATILYLATTVFIFFGMRAANKKTDKSLAFTKESFEISHRPYFAGSAPLDAQPFVRDAIVIEIVVKLRNSGFGAKNVLRQAYTRELSADETFHVREVIDQPPRMDTPILSVGANSEVTVGCGMQMTPEKYDKAMHRETTLYFVAILVYQDEFNKWHHYRVGYRYQPEYNLWEPYRDHRAKGLPPHLNFESTLERALGEGSVEWPE